MMKHVSFVIRLIIIIINFNKYSQKGFSVPISSCFNHDSRNALSDVNAFYDEACFIRDQTNRVSIMIREIHCLM